MGNGGGMGFNPAAMMASMAVGGVVGQNIAEAMGNAMSGMNQVNPAAVPPPIPVTMYHVAVNGQATGPFDMATLQQMAAAGQLTAASLIRKAGMTKWEAAETVSEIIEILGYKRESGDRVVTGKVYQRHTFCPRNEISGISC